MKTILTCTLLAALSFWVLPGRTMARETREEDLVLLVEQAPSGMEQTMAAPAEAKVYTPAAEQAEHETNIRLLCDGEVLELPLETYITGVLICEMPASFSPEAKKAQTVAARTFAVRRLEKPKHENADVCADAACCQAWTSGQDLQARFGADFDAVWQAAAQAVEETRGEILIYDEEPIDALFFSCSGGRTEPALAVWGSDVPYLQAVDSPGEQDAPRFSSSADFTPEEFAALLQKENPGITLGPAPEAWLGETTRSAGGGVAEMRIGGQSFTGVQLRRIFGLNSTNFTLSYQDGQFHFDVLGFGHRVGLSQYGAENMAQQGFDYRVILQYYYRGALLEQMQ
mgnify:FL=1